MFAELIPDPDTPRSEAAATRSDEVPGTKTHLVVTIHGAVSMPVPSGPVVIIGDRQCSLLML